MSENKYDFRKKLIEVHKPSIKKEKNFDSKSYLMLENGMRIYIEENADEVIKTAVYDFCDFLDISLGIDAIVKKGEPTEEKYIRIRLAEDAGVELGEASGYRGFMIETDKNIEIYAYDSRGAAQALYFLEDCMSFECYPIIKKETVRVKPAFSPQMVHSGYGFDEYPDNYLAKIAHEGRDAILVYTVGADLTPTGYMNFNELIERASKYGIDVYAYSTLKSEMNPEDEGAEEYYESNYGNLFKTCPGLKGVTLVGESVEFPSKDPNVAKGHYYETTDEGIIKGLPTSGMYPCEDYPAWLNLIKKVIRKYRSDADIVFWTYNWGSQPEEARVKLIESLPTDITLQVTFERYEKIKIGKAFSHCADYTLSFEGPSKCFISEAKAAKKRNIKLYSMTNTGGLTWDFGVIPYQPMPYQWIKRYEAMRNAKKEWGLSGIMECHHYGFYPSFISKLSKWAFFEPQYDMTIILEKIIKSEFGEENFEKVNEALIMWSEAITYYSPSNTDQYGAFRIGPSLPFYLYQKGTIPSDPERDKRGNGMFGSQICVPENRLGPDKRDSITSIRVPEELKSLQKMYELMLSGLQSLAAVESKNSETDALENLGMFMLNCIKTAISSKKWYILKNKFFASDNKHDLSFLLDDMEALLNEEIKNAKETVALVEKDSRLGWEPRMLYITDKYHLEWKIRQVKAVIEFEIGDYRKSLEL